MESVKYTEKRARPRSSNWEEDEKKLLYQLIQKEITIIECKETNTSMNNYKKASWKKVLESFNTFNKRPRTLSQLMTQWRNLKTSLKSKNSEYNSKVKTSPDDVDNGETSQPEILLRFEPEIDNNIHPCDSSRTEPKTRDYRKSISSKRKERDNDYEKQLFLLAKEAREKSMKYALREHQMKMEILDMEKQYWEKKLTAYT